MNDKTEAAKTADPKKTEAAKTPFADEITAAVAKLDHAKDADWTEEGLPSVKRVIQIAKNDKITRADINAVAGGVSRERKPLIAAGSRRHVKKGENAGEEVSNARVVAIRKGQYGGALRDVGEEFTFTGKLRSWMELATPKAKKDKAEA